MTEIVLATRNSGKVREIRNILRGIDVKLSGADDFTCFPDVEEDGKTLEENAAKKARVVALALKRWALADDSGLEVDYLEGEPGVYSARWAGSGCTYADNNRKLLRLLRGVPAGGRTARFRCVIALSSPRGKVTCVEGSIEGRIAPRLRGKNGFGYDPVFIVPRYGKTFAELSGTIKNRISHRALALKKAQKLIIDVTQNLYSQR